MASMEQLDALLQSLQALKPPGATKGKITAITKLCGDNVQVISQVRSSFGKSPNSYLTV
jgi:protein NRD1